MSRLTDLVAPAAERLAWAACGLGDGDDLAAQNAAMLTMFNRYPLVVDPAGTAVRFLQAQESSKIVVTSFLDAAFLKHVEAALRFGSRVIITDAEHLDPVLNPVLNREVRRAGGRVLVRLGAADVDVSPAFRLVLATRDASGAWLAADLASRVTLINFSVTRASLQAASLAHAMRHARADVDERRRALLRLQGELRLRLRALETQLLHALGAAQGSILDDDAVVATLETLKADAAAITRQAADADAVMRDVDAVAAAFAPLARAAAAVYFALDRLPALHGAYQFSLRFFDAIFRAAVAAPRADLPEPQRLAEMRAELFRLAYARAAPALHHDRQPALLLLLAQIKLRGDEDDSSSAVPASAWARLNADLDFVLQGTSSSSSSSAASASSVPIPPALDALLNTDADRRRALLEHVRALAWVRAWVQAVGAGDADVAFARLDEPERAVPRAALQLGDGEADALAQLPAAAALRELIVVRLVRPDRVLAAAARFAAAVFGEPAEPAGPEAALRAAAAESFYVDGEGVTPVALCSVAGHDAADRVDALAAEQRRALRAVAMGAGEGAKVADQAISAAAAAGSWVVLRNVHLAPAWLAQLEKRLQTLRAHADFRLFLTMEISAAVPAALLRRARTLVCEPPAGLRASLLDSLGSASDAPAAGPAERARLHFLVAWLHAAVVERLRYAPLGWTSRYEFSDADYACALATVDCWVDRAAQGRANVDPARIPWPAIRALLSGSVYGGRIDNDADRRVLESFVTRLFRADAYGADFCLLTSSGAPVLPAPEATAPRGFVRWCRELPASEPPAWLGLPPNAETLLLEQKGAQLLADTRRMRVLLDDDEDDEGLEEAAAGESADGGASSEAAQPAHLRQADAAAAGFEATLAEAAEIQTLDDAHAAAGTALFRVLQREGAVARALLATVRADLAQLREACRGERKQTNRLRALLADFAAGAVPRAWLATYAVPRACSLARWVADFADRLRAAHALARRIHAEPTDSIAGAVREQPVWLGGLLYPEAFITATRQAAAKRLACSLEELAIRLAVAADSPGGFAVCGLRIEGAAWDGGALALNDGSAEPLGPCAIEWTRRSSANEDQDRTVCIPVYLNTDRSLLLFEAHLPLAAPAGSASHGPDVSTVVQRAVAIVAA
ncbi:dynein heavy chain [Coemansia sp. RSA 2320]|nr:dynein heavy chain [Coemansia sp. RSA 2320]